MKRARRSRVKKSKVRRVDKEDSEDSDYMKVKMKECITEKDVQIMQSEFVRLSIKKSDVVVGKEELEEMIETRVKERVHRMRMRFEREYAELQRKYDELKRPPMKEEAMGMYG